MRLSDSSIAVLIDSTLPFLYLPLSVCEAFENAFGIEWNNDVQAYLVNNTLHATLQAQNATVTFTLESSVSGSQTVNISLPYAAFDFMASYPLMTNSSRYFPLVRATNESQYTLGRTFLQEAYVIADYERRNFSVSQCNWNGADQQHIVAIQSSTNADAKSPNDHLAAGKIAAIAIGSAVVIALITLTVLLKVKGWKAMFKATTAPNQVELSAEEKPSQEKLSEGTQEIDGERHLGTEIDGVKLPGHEIDGHRYHGQELEDNEERYRQELEGNDRRYELDGGQVYKHELPAREAAATEMSH
ncbi:hypothetical protein P7C71_g2907, partial [Lecanoromycetidae sp. Uapishka_2]